MNPSSIDRPRRDQWYSLPVVWLGIAVFVADVAGCAWLIAVSARYEDARLPTHPQVFGVSAHAAPPVPAR